MWIYDGEEWIEEGVSKSDDRPDANLPLREQFYPELQVVEVEIVPQTRTNYIPYPQPRP
jgi:hypothetical protein